MPRLFAVFVFILGVPLFFSAQAAGPKNATSTSIAGMVLKEPGSEPMKKVVLQIIAEDQKAGASYTASTDPDGHFRVDDVRPGRYRIFLERSGYVSVNDRGSKSEVTVLSIRLGQSVDNLVFRMQPTAVISGRVVDEDGDPMPEVRIIALREKPGKRRHESIGNAATNDLGEYRLAGLLAGKYIILATPPPDFRDYEKPVKPAAAADSPDASRSDKRYLPTYYPGTLDATQASVITLKVGDEMPVNVTITPSRTFRIRGIVTALSASDKPTVEVRSKAGDSIHAAPEVGRDGQFEVRGIAPGSYSVVATLSSESHPLTARQDVSVVAGDVDGVRLTPAPSFTLSGHLRVEGKANSNVGQFAVNLRPAKSNDNSSFFMSPDVFGTNAAVDMRGNFEWTGVTAGEYNVQIFGGDHPSSYFLKSATMGGNDIATGFTASGPASLELLVSFNGGTIAGVVAEKQSDSDGDHPATSAMVVAVPEEKFRQLPDHFNANLTDQNGHFALSALAPGTYTLFAWQDDDESVYLDPDFLKSQEANGTSVKVEENSHQQIKLNLSPVDAEWR